MFKKAKILALTVAMAAAPLLTTQIAAAAPEDITQTCTQWQIDQGLCEAGLRPMILKLINWVLLFLGLVATAILIYGGFQYITSAGNDQEIEKAKKLIIYAAVGILVIVLAAVLVNALLDIAITPNP